MGTEYTVRDGDCMKSIAFRHGFFPDTLWNHPENSALRDQRKADNVLLPGDTVHIPNLTPGMESGNTEEKHTFRRRGVPAVLRIVFTRRVQPEDEEEDAERVQYDGSTYEEREPDPEDDQPEYEPLANAPYVIFGDISAEGTSDSDGLVEIPIRPDAVRADIVFYRGTEDEVGFTLALGSLDPVDLPAGLSQRLYNLGYNCPKVEEMNDTVRAALRRFQSENDLNPSGEPDQATQDKLVEVHGS